MVSRLGRQLLRQLEGELEVARRLRRLDACLKVHELGSRELARVPAVCGPTAPTAEAVAVRARSPACGAADSGWRCDVSFVSQAEGFGVVVVGVFKLCRSERLPVSSSVSSMRGRVTRLSGVPVGSNRWEEKLVGPVHPSRWSGYVQQHVPRVSA